MAAAGYNPRASLDLWAVLNEIGLEGAQNASLLQKTPFLRTHPTGEQRLKVSSSSVTTIARD
jgi:predicted Zn-dependent protease